jgi:hypothetical protein
MVGSGPASEAALIQTAKTTGVSPKVLLDRRRAVGLIAEDGCHRSRLVCFEPAMACWSRMELKIGWCRFREGAKCWVKFVVHPALACLWTLEPWLAPSQQSKSSQHVDVYGVQVTLG